MTKPAAPLPAPTLSRDHTMLRNGRPYLRDTTREGAESMARRTEEAARKMGHPARFTIAK